MPKNRTTAQQRAREMQHAPGAQLSYGKALEAARGQLHPDQARKALRALAEANDIAVSWGDCFRGHLVAADQADWPNLEDTVGLCDELYRLTGVPAADDGLLGIPPALKYFPLDRLRGALEQGSNADFVCASVAALAGPLRHLLRHPYGSRPRQDDVIYRATKAPKNPSRRQVSVHTVDGLHLEDVPYPRPWGTPSVNGLFTSESAGGREELARAVLAHALGGAAPTSLASCGACHGNGWLTALDPEHDAHVPAYRPDGGPVCSCGGCRGTGLRPLPTGAFAATFLHRLQAQTSPDVSRSEILAWAAAHAPVQPAPAANCAEGLQGPYVQQVVAAVADAGFTVGGPAGLDGYELDFDEQGVLGAHFTVGGEAALREFATDSVLMIWFSDRGWSITGFGAVRRLLPADPVPNPHAVAQALLTPVPEENTDRISQRPNGSDPHVAVLAYLAPAQL